MDVAHTSQKPAVPTPQTSSVSETQSALQTLSASHTQSVLQTSSVSQAQSAPQTSPTPPALEFKQLSFSYPVADDAEQVLPVIDNVSFTIDQGAFCLVCGATGAGKSTLLRLAKPGLEPVGKRTGEVRIMGKLARDFDVASSAHTVGLVMQDPKTQLVCDSVWHELAFGLENVGCEPLEMRRRVAQLSYFLGLEPLFHQRCSELSDGQAQLVALASVLVLEPSILLLDEPTSMLDPLARADFAHALFRLNRELGITVVLATHEPWALVSYASCAVSIDNGAVHKLALSNITTPHNLGISKPTAAEKASKTAQLTGAWLRYSRESPWVLRGVNLSLQSGEIHALLGANGSGKSSVLKTMAGVLKPNRGICEPQRSSWSQQNLRHGWFSRPKKAGRAKGNSEQLSTSVRQGQSTSQQPGHSASTQPGQISTSAVRQAYLPQHPELLFSGLSVAEEIAASLPHGADPSSIQSLIERLGLSALLDRDPLELSRGQRQLVAIAKVLAAQPTLLFADEPTVGLDLAARTRVAELLSEYAQAGTTMLLATHDLLLARELAHVCSLLFDGEIACTMPSEEFFERSLFFREESLS